MPKLKHIEIRDLRPSEHEDAARLLARAFRDLPTTKAALGPDAGRRMRFLWRAYRAFVPVMRGRILSAWNGDALVGVTGIQHPGECRLTPEQLVRMGAVFATSGFPVGSYRCAKVFHERDRRDSEEPHIHLEPIAVDPAVAMLGVGQAMGEATCRYADELGLPIFGITERFTTTKYLSEFGVDLIDEFEILGVPNFSMRRRP